MMWQIVFAVGAKTEFEDNLIWRAADLLGIPQHERIALRDRVAAQKVGETAQVGKRFPAPLTPSNS